MSQVSLSQSPSQLSKAFDYLKTTWLAEICTVLMSLHANELNIGHV